MQNKSERLQVNVLKYFKVLFMKFIDTSLKIRSQKKLEVYDLSNLKEIIFLVTLLEVTKMRQNLWMCYRDRGKLVQTTSKKKKANPEDSVQPDR